MPVLTRTQSTCTCIESGAESWLFLFCLHLITRSPQPFEINNLHAEFYRRRNFFCACAALMAAGLSQLRIAFQNRFGHFDWSGTIQKSANSGSVAGHSGCSARRCDAGYAQKIPRGTGNPLSRKEGAHFMAARISNFGCGCPSYGEQFAFGGRLFVCFQGRGQSRASQMRRFHFQQIETLFKLANFQCRSQGTLAALR